MNRHRDNYRPYDDDYPRRRDDRYYTGSRRSRSRSPYRSPPLEYSEPVGHHPRYSDRQDPDMYRFRGASSYHDGARDDREQYREYDRGYHRYDHRQQFDFRPVDAPTAPSFDRRDPPRPTRGAMRGRGSARGRGRGAPWVKPATHERALLSSARERTPEQLTGMNDGTRFKTVGDADESDNESRAKRIKTAPAGPDPPKWSNVDAYGVVVPAEPETRRPKDIVGMIRKAKVDAPSAAPAAAGDFVSLDFDPPVEKKAPFSHLDNLHPDRHKPMGQTKSQAARPAAPPHDVSQPDIISISSEASSPARPAKSGAKRKRPTDPRPLDNSHLNHLLRSTAEAWRHHPQKNAVPWISRQAHGDAEFALHDEIRMWYEYCRPTDNEETVRLNIIARIQKAVSLAFPQVEVRSFGSFASKLYLPIADMDLVALSTSFVKWGARSLGQSRNQMSKFANALERARIVAPGTLVIIAKSRVPIIKFKDQLTGVRIDISFDNDSGIIANDTLNRWKERFPAMPPIVLLIKQFLAMRDLHEVHGGGLGGFSIICLVCCTIARIEEDARDRGEEWDSLGHLDEILMYILEWFGYDWDTASEALDMQTFRVVPRSAFQGQHRDNFRLLIIDPNNSSNDVSGGTSRIHDIFGLFRSAYKSLNDRMDRYESEPPAGNSTMISCLLAANYDSYVEQRQRLQRLGPAPALNGTGVATLNGSSNPPKTLPPAKAQGTAPKAPAKPTTVPAKRTVRSGSPPVDKDKDWTVEDSQIPSDDDSDPDTDLDAEPGPSTRELRATTVATRAEVTKPATKQKIHPNQFLSRKEKLANRRAKKLARKEAVALAKGKPIKDKKQGGGEEQDDHVNTHTGTSHNSKDKPRFETTRAMRRAAEREADSGTTKRAKGNDGEAIQAGTITNGTNSGTSTPAAELTTKKKKAGKASTTTAVAKPESTKNQGQCDAEDYNRIEDRLFQAAGLPSIEDLSRARMLRARIPTLSNIPDGVTREEFKTYLREAKANGTHVKLSGPEDTELQRQIGLENTKRREKIYNGRARKVVLREMRDAARAAAA